MHRIRSKPNVRYWAVNAADVREVYQEIWRVLKPGGIFGFHDWVMTDVFDEGVKRHRLVRNQIELGNGITGM